MTIVNEESTLVVFDGFDKQNLEVLFQDEVVLDIEVPLYYIKSGEEEVQHYVETVAKPEIDNHTEAAKTALDEFSDLEKQEIADFADVRMGIVENGLDNYAKETIKPQLDEIVAAAQTAEANAKASEGAAAGSAAAAVAIAESFDTHAAEKQTAFDDNYSVKVLEFNGNATEKTADFNANAAEKQTAVDASAGAAAVSATEAANSATEAAASAASVDSTKIKRIGYENHRHLASGANILMSLQDTDEIIFVVIDQNCTITIDDSQLTFPKDTFTFQMRLAFPGEAKTVSFSGKSLFWINGIVPDFSSGKIHDVNIRLFINQPVAVISDGGSEG